MEDLLPDEHFTFAPSLGHWHRTSPSRAFLLYFFSQGRSEMGKAEGEVPRKAWRRELGVVAHTPLTRVHTVDLTNHISHRSVLKQ